MAVRIMSLQKTRRRGLSLLEIILALGVTALILLGVMHLYSESVTKSRTNDLVEEVALIYKAVYELTNGGTTGGMGFYVYETSLIQSNLMPAKYYNAAHTDLVSPFGGEIFIPGPSGDNGGELIWLFEVPYEACVTLATTEWGMNTNLNINYEADGGTGTFKGYQGESLCNSGSSNTIGITLSPR